ncbi:hypothetical protein Btru_013041 [Bulinus truncatus]|nr:hypothetical protein Btru_013041 [Bulinus truncatus]
MDDQESEASTEYTQDTITDLAFAESTKSKKDTAATLPDTGPIVEAENEAGDTFAEMKLLKEIVMVSRESFGGTQQVSQASAQAKMNLPLRLEDILRHQLHTWPKTNRATQTNWGWRLMAERWRHARIIPAKTKPMELSDLKDHLIELKMKAIMQEEDHLQDELKGSELTDDWLKRIWNQKKMDILEALRSLRECDKTTDTGDLELNPGDSPMSRNQVKLSGRTLKDSKTDIRTARLHSVRSVGANHHQHSGSHRRMSHAKTSLSPDLAMVKQQLMSMDIQWAPPMPADRGSRRHSILAGAAGRKSFSRQRGSRADSEGSEKRHSQASARSIKAEVAEIIVPGGGGGGGTQSHSRRDSKVSNASKKSTGRKQSMEQDRQSYEN